VKTPPLVMDAIDALCVRFEMGDYNPTPIIDLGVLVANADGAVDAAEVEALGSIIGALLGARMDGELVGFMAQASIDVANQAGAASRARLVAEILMDCDAVEEGLIVALAVAFASEGLKTSERALIASIARAAEYDAGKLDALIERVRSAVAA
jgi:tellurite resistance protein